VNGFASDAIEAWSLDSLAPGSVAFFDGLSIGPSLRRQGGNQMAEDGIGAEDRDGDHKLYVCHFTALSHGYNWRKLVVKRKHLPLCANIDRSGDLAYLPTRKPLRS
jgi:hypothetical protein